MVFVLGPWFPESRCHAGIYSWRFSLIVINRLLSLKPGYLASLETIGKSSISGHTF